MSQHYPAAQASYAIVRPVFGVDAIIAAYSTIFTASEQYQNHSSICLTHSSISLAQPSEDATA